MSSLAAFVSEKQWTQLEDAWTELMVQEGPIDPAIEALLLAGEKKQIPRCVALVREHAEMLRANNRPADAAELLGLTMLQGGNPGELSGALFEAVTEAYSGEDWYERYAEISGLQANAPDMRTAWKTFSKCLNMRADAAVFHAKGWGLGLVTEIDGDDVHVKFLNGRRDRFPFRTAVEIFEVLPDHDFRSLVVKDPDEMKRLLKEDPLEVLRNVLVRFRGRATYPVIKGALSQLGVDGSGFTGWWRKARKHAESSEWFEISGTATKAQAILLATAADPAEAMKRSLRKAGSLGRALTRVRDLLAGGSVDDGVRAAGLETLQELATDDEEAFPERLATWTFLRDHLSETPGKLLALLEQEYVKDAPEDPSQPPALWSLFQEFPTSRDQERCVGLLAELIPDDQERMAFVIEHLQHAAPGMVRPLVAELMEKKRQDELAQHYIALLGRPTRNPALLIALGELAENGKIEGEWPQPIHRAQAFIQLATYLESRRLRSTSLARAHQRLSGFLAGAKPSVLRRLLEGVDKSLLRSTLHMVERGVDGPIDTEMVAIVADHAPELFREDDKPFWESGLWTTRVGLDKRQAELRELVDVKLPANSEAIGKAASYGDLSENSEWEAAMEEQRNLTTRASEMEAEIREAHVIEDVSLPDDTVAPGTRVRFREVESGREREVLILGPWEADGETVISYKAPLAAGMLGLGKSERGTLQLPSGPLEVQILEIRPFDVAKA